MVRKLVGAVVLACAFVFLAATTAGAAPNRWTGQDAAKDVLRSCASGADALRQSAAAQLVEGQLATVLASAHWRDAVNDNDGLLDMYDFAVGTNDDGSLALEFTFAPPFEPSEVGGTDWIDVLLDVDGAVGTGSSVYDDAGDALIAHDFLVDFVYSLGTWTADVARTPSNLPGSWENVLSVPAWQETNSDGSVSLRADIPLAEINDPAHLHLLAYTEYWTSDDTYEADWVPDALDFAEYDVLPPLSPFPDVLSTAPYAKQISDLAAREVILGYSSGQFGPDDRVKRQQFAKMIVLSLGLPTTEADISPFSDVDASGPASLYPDNYVAVCAAEGITVGTGGNRFSPWNDITRAQLFTMVVRAAGLPEPPPVYQPPFGNFSSTHYPFARKAFYYGMLNDLAGMGRGYDFWKPATRGETAAVLYNLLHRLPPRPW